MKRLTADHRYAPSLAWRQNSTIDFERALKPIDVKYLERLLRETEREVGEHWREVEAVAMALLAREVPGAMDLFRIIRRRTVDRAISDCTASALASLRIARVKRITH